MDFTLLLSSLVFLYGCACENFEIDQYDSSTDIEENGISVESFPFVVSIYDIINRSHHCTGVIISPYWIVTTASCLVEISKVFPSLKYVDKFYVIAGVSNIKDWGKYYQKRKIVYFIAHPDYNSKAIGDDIGLLKVELPFESSDQVGIARIPSYYTDEEINECVTVGWDCSDPWRPTWQCSNLRNHSVDIIDTIECLKYFHNDAVTLGYTFCTVWANGIWNTPCVSDIGAPLLCDYSAHENHGEDIETTGYGNPNIWKGNGNNSTSLNVVGLFSLGYACGQFGTINYETNLIHYNGWIKSTINGCSNSLLNSMPLFLIKFLIILPFFHFIHEVTSLKSE